MPSPLIGGDPLSAVFGLSSSLPQLVGGGGGQLVGKANLLSDHFDRKQYKESVVINSLTTFSFRSSEVGHLLLDLEPYGGTNPLGMFPFFLKRTADITPLPSAFEFFTILENKLIGYTDVTPLCYLLYQPKALVTVAHSLNRDIGKSGVTFRG